MNKSSKTFTTEENSVGKCPDCSVEVGTIFDGEDRIAEIHQIYETEILAKEALAVYTAKAYEAQSEPCKISSTLTPVENGVLLDAQFEFSCQAEKVIFQLKMR